MTNRQHMLLAHAVTRTLRAAEPQRAATEPYTTTLGQQMAAIRAAYLDSQRVKRTGQWARGPRGTVQCWLSGPRPKLGVRVRVVRRDGHSSRFFVHDSEWTGTRWLCTVDKLYPGFEALGTPVALAA